MNSFNINITGADVVKRSMEKFSADVQKKISDKFNEFGVNTVADAKTNAPVDEGFLKNSITFDLNETTVGVSVEIVVAANYAAYVEFGTRKFAEEYVASLPANWQDFAEKFRGGGGGSFADFVQRLTDWVHRKGLGDGYKGKIGITGTYSIKTRKRTGGKSTQESEDKQVAYRIALKILRDGIRAQPFLYPAVEKNRLELVNELNRIFK